MTNYEELWKSLLDTVEFRLAVLEGELEMYRKDANLPPEERLWEDSCLVETTRARLTEMDNVLFKMKRLMDKDTAPNAGQ